jgi:hypothetical protein
LLSSSCHQKNDSLGLLETISFNLIQRFPELTRQLLECIVRNVMIFCSSNRTETLLVFPENESHQQKVAYSLADSVVFAQQNKS